MAFIVSPTAAAAQDQIELLVKQVYWNGSLFYDHNLNLLAYITAIS